MQFGKNALEPLFAEKNLVVPVDTTKKDLTVANEVITNNINESLPPFFSIFPQTARTKFESTKLMIDNASSYLSVNIKGGKIIVDRFDSTH